jgi:hypothetical protein
MHYGGFGEQQQPQGWYQPGPYPPSNFRGQGRSRGRGAASRGRGRGKGLPTFDEHFQQVQKADSRTTASNPKANVEVKISKESLGEQLNSFFDVSASPAVALEHYDVNVLGYQELIHQTYNAVSVTVKDSTTHLSEEEFALACGWLLYKRVFDIWRSHSNVLRSLEAFDDVVAKDTVLPAPIAEYLSHLGCYKDDTGVKVLPRIYLPNFDNNQAAGTLPVEGFGNVHELNKFTAFFPFAMYVRRFFQQGGNALYAASADWTKVRVNPGGGAAALADPEDPFVGRMACYNFALETRTIAARRVDLLTPAYAASFATVDNIRGRCLYSNECMQNFATWCTFISARYSCKAVSSDTVGSKAVAAYCSPLDGDDADVPTRYEHFSSLALSKSEMCIAVVFKYRIAVERDDNCVDGINQNDQLDTVNSSPVTFNAPGRTRINAPEENTATVLPFVLKYAVRA